MLFLDPLCWCLSLAKSPLGVRVPMGDDDNDDDETYDLDLLFDSIDEQGE